jgi:hypothetical protein
MKRILIASIIAILLLTAVQPTVVFHYCKGDLHSVGLLKTELPKSCCGEKHKNCCSNHILKIATDDFQLQQQQDFTETLPQVPTPVFLTLFNNLFSSASLDLLVIQHTFPPGGLAGHSGADLLHQICVYRI